MSFTFVQGTGVGSSGSVASLTATFGSAVTVGNTVFVTFNIYSTTATPTAPTVADGHGNTYTADFSSTISYGGGSVWETFYSYRMVVPSGSGLALAITITPPSSTYCNLAISEFAVAGGVAAIESSQPAAVYNVGTSIVTGTAPVAGSGPDLILAMAETNGTVGHDLSVPSGFTQIWQNNYVSGTTLGSCYAYKLNVTAGTAATFPLGASASAAAGVASYKIVPPSYSVSGPSTGAVGAASTNFTVTPSGTISSDTITFGDGGQGGTFTPTSLNWSASASAKTFTYTPASTGAKTLTLTSGASYTVTGSPATYTVSATYALTGPSTGTVGAPSSNFTLTPSGTITSDTVTFSDSSAGGTFTPTSFTFTNSSTAQTFTYTAASTGAKTLTLTSGDSYSITGSPATYTPSTSTTYSFTGPTSGVSGVASTNFTLTPSQSTTDTVSLSDGSQGGTFTPTSLNWASSAAAKTFTYTPASAGNKVITPLSGTAYVITPSTITYASSAAATGYTISGASTGVLGIASGNITCTPNGTVSGTQTVSITVGGAGGTVSSTLLTFTNTAAPQSVTFTGTAVGASTLTFTGSSGFTTTNSPWSITVSATPSYVYVDSWVTSMPTGYASSATIVPKTWNGTAIAAISGGSYSLGAIVESTDQPGAYSCRVGIATSVLAAGTAIRIAWTVGGVTVVNASPLGPSAAIDGGLSPLQAINQILAMVAGVVADPPTGSGSMLFMDPTGATSRVTMEVDGLGGRPSTAHTPPVA